MTAKKGNKGRKKTRIQDPAPERRPPDPAHPPPTREPPGVTHPGPGQRPRPGEPGAPPVREPSDTQGGVP
jgi:hypothetical protein